MALPFPSGRRTDPASTDPASAASPLGDAAAGQQEKLAVVGYLATSIAHELGSPLATILASAQSLLAMLPPADGPEITVDPAAMRHDLRLISDEAHRAGAIVGSLLALARNREPERCLLALTDVLRRTATLVERQLASVDILLDAPILGMDSPVPEWARIWGDAGRIQQVLLNLIVNAQQAIRSVRHTGQIRISLGHQQGMAAVIVEDDGPGIPAHLRAKIFQPFFTTKRPGEGTGLGLSITADLVRQHDGVIRLEESPLGGARFVLLFPPAMEACPAGPRAASVGTNEARAGESRGRILLVDDEAGLRLSFKRLLTRQGFEVTAEPTAEDALRELRAAPYDVVVTDLNMPGLSGEEFYQRVVAEFPDLRRRVVFSSGDMSRDEARALLQRTSCPGLQKPYEVGDLAAVLDGLLAKHAPVGLFRAG